MGRKGEGYVCLLSYSCIRNARSNVVWSEYGHVRVEEEEENKAALTLSIDGSFV